MTAPKTDYKLYSSSMDLEKLEALFRAADQPDQEDVESILPNYLDEGEFSKTKKLLELTGNNKPRPRIIANQLLRLASREPNYYSDDNIGGVRLLCESSSEDSKPQQDTLDKALSSAPKKEKPKIFSYLCSLPNDKQPHYPSQEAVDKALLDIINEVENQDYLKALLRMEKDNKPSKNAIKNAVLKVIASKNYPELTLLCHLERDNQLTLAEVEEELEKAINAEDWSVVNIFCHMTGANKPTLPALLSAYRAMNIKQNNMAQQLLADLPALKEAVMKLDREEEASDLHRRQVEEPLQRPRAAALQTGRLQSRVYQKENHQDDFNQMIEECVVLAQKWMDSGFYSAWQQAFPKVENLRDYGEIWNSFSQGTFFSLFQSILSSITVFEQTPFCGLLFRKLQDCFCANNKGRYISAFSLPEFILQVNAIFDQELKKVSLIPPAPIQYEYTGNNEQVKNHLKPLETGFEYHQNLANELIEAHVACHNWSKHNNYAKPIEGYRAFPDNNFSNVLLKHHFLKALSTTHIEELYESAYKRERYEISALIREFQLLLNRYIWRDRDFYPYNFTQYTGQDPAVLQVFQEAEEAKRAKVIKLQTNFNSFLETTQCFTNTRFKQEQYENYFNTMIFDRFREIIRDYYGAHSTEDKALKREQLKDPYNKAINPDESFDYLTFIDASKELLEEQYNINLSYTGEDPDVLRRLSRAPIDLPREAGSRLQQEQAAASRLQQEEALRLQQAEASRLQQEEASRLQQAEAARLQQEEAARLQQEEAARLQQEEALRLQQEEASRSKQQEEALLRQQQEETSRQPQTQTQTKDTQAEPTQREETTPSVIQQSQQTEPETPITPKPLVPEPQPNELKPQPTLQATSTPKGKVKMLVLGGFIGALGIAAVALAFTLLNAATLGIAGLVLASLGAAAVLGSIGLFAGACYKKPSEAIQNDLEPESAALELGA